MQNQDLDFDRDKKIAELHASRQESMKKIIKIDEQISLLLGISTEEKATRKKKNISSKEFRALVNLH